MKVQSEESALVTRSNELARLFETLGKENINISMISTSEIKISCVIEEKYTELAVRILHEAFGLENDQFRDQ